jgi:hypothetical protein
MDVMEMFRLIYQEELPPDIGPIRKLLQDYSDINLNQVESHLYKIVRPNMMPNPVVLRDGSSAPPCASATLNTTNPPLSENKPGGQRATHALAAGASSTSTRPQIPGIRAFSPV